MKKGFTLIELLAVIVIIGIIALITYPIVNNVIAESEKNTFKASIEELKHITELDYTEFSRTGSVTYTLNNKDLTCNNCTNKIKYNGEIEEGSGTLTITNGKVNNININSKYYTATLNDGKIQIEKK